MIIGDLVKHNPIGSPIEMILRKLGSGSEEGDLKPDFNIGVIVDQNGDRSRIFSHSLTGPYWYDNSELTFVEHVQMS